MRSNKTMAWSKGSINILSLNREAIVFGLYAFLIYGLMRLIFPVMLRYDDSWILLTNYSWANGLGFDNAWANPISSGMFNWHGFLQPVIIAWLMPGPRFADINFAVFLLGLSYLSLWFVVVNIMIFHRYLRYMLYVIGVSGALHFSARPELLASFLSMLIVLALFSGPPSLSLTFRAMLAGALVGLAAVTSPATGVLAGLGVAAAIAYLRSGGSVRAFFLDGLLAMTAAAMMGALMVWFVYPHEPNTWIEGVREHAAVNGLRNDANNFIKYYVLTPLMPMLLLPLSLLIIIGATTLNLIRGYFFMLAFFAISVSFLFGVYYLAIRIPASYYNFSFAVPVICLAAGALTGRESVRVAPGVRLSHLVLGMPLLLFAIACALSQTVWVAQKTVAGFSYATVEQEISASVDQYLAEGRTIAMDPPLAIAVDDADTLQGVTLLFFGMNKDPQVPPPVDVLLRAQTELGRLHDDVPGFRMVRDRQTRNVLTRVMKPLSLHYVVYEREGLGPGTGSRGATASGSTR